MAVAVLLTNPKNARNVGAALRVVSCHGGGALYFTGDRIGLKGLSRLPREERMRDYEDTPWHQLLGQDEQRPVDTIIRREKRRFTPVAVELLPSSEPLDTFQHPDDALYVFGPEDGSLPDGIRPVCHRFVYIPSFHCLNLATAVATVMYDRTAKAVAGGAERPSIRGEGRGYFHDTIFETDTFS